MDYAEADAPSPNLDVLSVARGILGAARKPVDVATQYYSGLPEALDPKVPYGTGPSAGDIASEAAFPTEGPESRAKSVARGIARAVFDLATDPIAVAGAVGGAGAGAVRSGIDEGAFSPLQAMEPRAFTPTKLTPYVGEDPVVRYTRKLLERRAQEKALGGM